MMMVVGGSFSSKREDKKKEGSRKFSEVGEVFDCHVREGSGKLEFRLSAFL